MIGEEKSYNSINNLLNKFFLKIRKQSKSNNTYDLISFPKDEIWDYDLVLSIMKNKIKVLNNNNFILYITKANLKSIKINNKEDWDDYYNNGVIQKYIDEKKNKSSEIKIEYTIYTEKSKDYNYENHKIKKIQYIITYYDQFKFIEKLIDFIINNENVLFSFKNYLIQTIKLKNNSDKNKLKNEYFSSLLKEKINEIKSTINKLKDLNTTIKEFNNKIINSEIINYIPNNKEIKSMYEPKTNLNLKNIINKESNNNNNNNIIISNNDEEDYILDFDGYDKISFPSFMSFYKNKEKFHENLINETMNSINPMNISNL